GQFRLAAAAGRHRGHGASAAWLSFAGRDRCGSFERYLGSAMEPARPVRGGADRAAGRAAAWLAVALLAAGYLVLAQHEAMAPLWTLAFALALGLLLRALPEGRLRTFARGGAIAAFALAALCALPFTAAQLQYAMHPQLEKGVTTRVVSAEFIAPPPDMVVQ